MNKDVKVLGHRGYRAQYPENTLLAFDKAFKAGAQGIECDVQKSRDGYYMIIHDDTITRVSGQSGRVADMTLDALKKVDLGGGQKIPELEELLRFLPADKLINIELKEETISSDDCPPICNMLLSHLERKNLIVSSFEHSLLPYFKQRQVTTGMLLGDKHLGLGIIDILRRILAIQPDCLNLPVEIFQHINKHLVYLMIRLAKAFKKKIVFWTVNTDEQVALISSIADVIITDDVDRILKIRNRA
jgi:glycerophosphoryl diester phosphodiesterase